MSERIIRKSNTAPGGRRVEIEVTDAYTDGRSRFDEVFVLNARLVDKTKEQKQQAVFEAAVADELAELYGSTVAEPLPTTKEVIEDKMVLKYEEWLRWKTTRIEAVARNEPNIQNALTNKENSAWAKYVELIQAWRLAP